MAAAPLDEDLKASLNSVAIIDTHEHLEEEETRLSRALDVSSLFSPHAGFDLVAAGMAAPDLARFYAPETDLDEKWRLIGPYWPSIRLGGSGQAIRRAVRDLYAGEELSSATCQAVSEAMQASNRPGVHDHILRERAGIETYLLANLDGPAALFRETGDARLSHQKLSLRPFLANELPLDDLARQSGLPAGSLRELLRVIDWAFSRYGDRAVAIHNRCAYWRSLRFDDVTQGQAESLFDRGYVAQEGLSSSETKALQDFLFHYCIRCASDYRLPITIHTGVIDGNNRLDISRIRAVDLIPLFRKYPHARFVLEQMGYPYQHEVLALARHFSNVYVDLAGCWALDADATPHFVREWIRTAPLNKLFAFGGSAFVAELAYGQAALAREGLARVLSELVAEGALARSDAEDVAARLLRENARIAFRLDDKRQPRP